MKARTYQSRGRRRAGRLGRDPNKRRAGSCLPTSTSLSTTHIPSRTMASASTSRDCDIEAQRDVLQPHQIGEEEIRETSNRDTSRPFADLAQPAVLQAIGKEIEEKLIIHETSTYQSERDNTTRQTPTRVENGDVQSGADNQAQHVADLDSDLVADNSSQETRMIGDFDGSDNAFWSLYGKEAKSHDEARIQPLKEDMDGVLLFAGLFSAALTSFVVDSKQNLQVKPTDQIVYYLQQHSTILSQISQQIASIAPEVSIPSTSPQPFPFFRPSLSDIRINAFWFMALAFSLSSALLAILVQQWVRDYMHVFQRYSDPQKSARMRQYLYEGSEGWYMPLVAEAVPGLLHVSLFLFFAGLADSTLNINTTIGVTTTVPIGICGLVYIFTTFAPVIYPQSPYQTSFSGVIWYGIQKLHGRRFMDRDGESKSVSTNMAQGQLQLSMESTKERKGRDKRAIVWLLDNQTEDAEIESFVTSLPGYLEMWTDSKEDVLPVVAQHPSMNAMVHRPALHPANTLHPIIPSIRERNTTREFCWRIGYFFNTCKNRAVFASDEVRQRCARACFEAMASLVFNTGAEVSWFGDTFQVLKDVGSFEGMYKLSLAGKDEAFVARWTCLSIMALRPTLKRPKLLFFLSAEYDPQDKKAREADEILEHWWGTERESRLSSKMSFAAGIIQEVEDGIQRIIRLSTVSPNEAIHKLCRRIAHQLPGVDFDLPDSEPFLRQTLNLFRDPAKLRFISCRQPPNNFLDFLKRIDAYQDNSPNSEYEQKQLVEEVIWPKDLLQRRLWSIDDLFEGGLAFAVELFLLSLRQLLSTYPSQESYSALYISTFRAITSDRRKYGGWTYDATQNILIDVVASDQGFLRTFNYPDYITDEVWALLGDMLEGRTGRHIDIAVQKLTDLHREVGGRYGAKVAAVISRIRQSHSHGPSAPTDSE